MPEWFTARNRGWVFEREIEIKTALGWLRRRVRRAVPIVQASEAVKWGRIIEAWDFVIASS